MRVRATWLVALAAAGVMLADAGAQTQPAGGSRATLDVLLQEVRLLRQAIERQSASAARTELVVGRIALQDQRVARARDFLGRVESELGSAEQERINMQGALRELTTSVEQLSDEGRRADLERELRLLKERIAIHGRHVVTLQARQSEAAQALEAESARYEELDGWLRTLDQELRRPAQ